MPQPYHAWPFKVGRASSIVQRDPETVRDFMEDLASRLADRVQVTTEGLKADLTAVKTAFGNDIDYSMVIRIHRTYRL